MGWEETDIPRLGPCFNAQSDQAMARAASWEGRVFYRTVQPGTAQGCGWGVCVLACSSAQPHQGIIKAAVLSRMAAVCRPWTLLPLEARTELVGELPPSYSKVQPGNDQGYDGGRTRVQFSFYKYAWP